jgi:hypothetical protein
MPGAVVAAVVAAVAGALAAAGGGMVAAAGGMAAAAGGMVAAPGGMVAAAGGMAAAGGAEVGAGMEVDGAGAAGSGARACSWVGPSGTRGATATRTHIPIPRTRRRWSSNYRPCTRNRRHRRSTGTTARIRQATIRTWASARAAGSRWLRGRRPHRLSHSNHEVAYGWLSGASAPGWAWRGGGRGASSPDPRASRINDYRMIGATFWFRCCTWSSVTVTNWG